MTRGIHVAYLWKEIEKNGYNLNISRYVSTAPEEKIIDIEEVAKELRTIEYDIKKAKECS